MSEELYITVRDVMIEDESGHSLPWKRADVVFNGTVVISGWAPNFSVYKLEGIAESSAISRAQHDFAAKYLNDIRGVEDAQGIPSWVGDVAAGVRERHNLRAGGAASSETTASGDVEVSGAKQ